MASTTRTPMALAEALSQAQAEGTKETFQLLFEAALSKHHNLNLLDTVFDGFLKTNVFRGQNYQLCDLFSVKSKRYFKFEHMSIPYLATVFTVEGHDTDWLNIKLCNGGFEYLAKPGKPISRHQSDQWVSLPPGNVLPCFTSIVAAAKPYFSSARIFYNAYECRIDMKFFPKDPNKTPAMVVTYEPGYPFMDDEAEEWLLP